MKRYIVEMSNDFEKRFPDSETDIIKVRNSYISGFITEIDAVKTLLNIAEQQTEKTFVIAFHGTVLVECETLNEAKKRLKELESEDKEQGFYEKNRYKIMEVK